jgi:HEAT repeat protein
MPSPADDFQAQWRDRLASGSKLAAKALAQAAKEDASRVPLVAALCSDASPHVRVSALRALADVSHSTPQLVAPHAREIVQGLAWSEPDAQESALAALGQIAALAPAEAALALPLIAELLANARRPGIREEAARCLGRIGVELPDQAPRAAGQLATRLASLRSARAAQEAREALAALEALVPHLPAPERAALAPRIAPLRGHPNIQVRERAGKLARALGG